MPIHATSNRVIDHLDKGSITPTQLSARDGKGRLPNGYLADLTARTGKSRRELGYRVQFAETYPTETELANALASYPSWREVAQSLKKATPPVDSVLGGVQDAAQEGGVSGGGVLLGSERLVAVEVSSLLPPSQPHCRTAPSAPPSLRHRSLPVCAGARPSLDNTLDRV